MNRFNCRILFLCLLFMTQTKAEASEFEMFGFAGYASTRFDKKPPAYQETGSGIGYGFFGRLGLGMGQAEGGFLYTPTSISWTVGSSTVKAQGSYWILPLLYRIQLLPPFLSIGAGVDYAFQGSTSYAIAGSSVVPSASGFQNHAGLQTSVQVAQDLGENLSVLLDIRYRHALASGITVNNTDVRYNFTMFSVGLQKRLE